MNYEQIIRAHNYLYNFADIEMNIKDAYAVADLIGKVNDKYYEYVALERELLNKFQGEVQPNGDINFIHGDNEESIRDGEDNVNKFVYELNELRNKEFEEEITPVILSCDMYNDLRISPNDISTLDGLVIFK